VKKIVKLNIGARPELERPPVNEPTLASICDRTHILLASGGLFSLHLNW
jgi:hypothetical protein